MMPPSWMTPPRWASFWMAVIMLVLLVLTFFNWPMNEMSAWFGRIILAFAAALNALVYFIR